MPDREPRDVLGEALWRLETATGPDREIDALIAEITGAPFGRFGYADEENEIAPRFTASVDVAQSLVPPGWFWQVGRTSAFDGWANVYQTHPDHGEAGRNEFHCNSDPWERRPDRRRAATPAMCLCVAALQARFSDAGQRSLAEAGFKIVKGEGDGD